MTSMKVPTIIKGIAESLAKGNSALVQLTNTDEAAQERALAGMEPGEELDDLDITPRDVMIQLVQNNYPVIQMEEYTDPVTNRTLMRPVMDAAGNPVLNPDAVRDRDNLIDRLASIRVPEGPLDQIINHFGDETVAEVTGRSRRVTLVTQRDGSKHKAIQKLVAFDPQGRCGTVCGGQEANPHLLERRRHGRGLSRQPGHRQPGTPRPLPLAGRLDRQQGGPGPGPRLQVQPGHGTKPETLAHQSQGGAAIHQHYRPAHGTNRRCHQGPSEGAGVGVVQRGGQPRIQGGQRGPDESLP